MRDIRVAAGATAAAEQYYATGMILHCYRLRGAAHVVLVFDDRSTMRFHRGSGLVEWQPQFRDTWEILCDGNGSSGGGGGGGGQEVE